MNSTFFRSFVCEYLILFKETLAAAGGQQDIAASSIYLCAGITLLFTYKLPIT